MANSGELRINSMILPKEGRLYSPGWLNFEVKQRTINRTLVSDLQGIKRKFTIAWDRVYGTLFADLIDLYLDNVDVTFTEVKPDLTEAVYNCRLSIPQSVRRELESGEYGYTGFSITLEEI